MIALSIDGVLRQPSGAPIPSGNLLYRALTEVTNVALIADEQTEEEAKHWLLVNNMTEHNYLVVQRAEDAEDPGQRRVEQLIRLSAAGPIDLLIESDPAKAEAAMGEGIPVLVAAHPAYSRPEHLPGNKRLPTPWSRLMEAVERQHALKAQDTRVSEIV